MPGREGSWGWRCPCAWPLASEVGPRRKQSHQAQDIHTITSRGSKVGHRKPLTGIPRKRSFSERASVRPQIVHLSALQPSSRFVRRAFCYLCVRYGFRGRFSREFTQTVRPALCPCDSVRARPRHVGPEASAHGLRSFRAPPRSISPRLFKRPVAVHTRHRPRHGLEKARSKHDGHSLSLAHHTRAHVHTAKACLKRTNISRATFTHSEIKQKQASSPMHNCKPVSAAVLLRERCRRNLRTASSRP